MILLYLGIRNISGRRGGESGTGTWGWKRCLNYLVRRFACGDVLASANHFPFGQWGSPLQHRNHLEACYCVSGYGGVASADGLVLIGVFNPPLSGDEKHVVTGSEFSSY